MRILIINFFHPPVVAAHAYRWDQIGRHWAAQGHQIDVISSRLLGVADETRQDGIHISRVGLFTRPVMRTEHGTGWTARLTRTVMATLRPIYRKFYWPDGMWHWLPGVMREVWRRRGVRYDLVISYYPCLAAHLAAAALKRWSDAPGITWVADYGDPFSPSDTMPPNNFALFDRLNRRMEHRIARDADKVVFTSDSTARVYTEQGICPPDKLQIIPHLADVANLYAPLRDRAGPTDAAATTRLLYVGGFHRGIREPDLLFDLIRRLNRAGNGHQYVLTIYGPANGFDLAPADCPQIQYLGMIERERALELMREADILVNVDNKNCVMVPSKIVEYIGTGHPLLDLGSGGPVHPAAARYAQLGFALQVAPDAALESAASAVEKFVERVSGRLAPREVIEDVLRDHTLQDIAGRYLALAGPVAGGR